MLVPAHQNNGLWAMHTSVNSIICGGIGGKSFSLALYRCIMEALG